MSKYLKAADDAKKLVKMFEALGEVAEGLEVLGKLEQTESESNARIAKARKDAEALEAKNADAAAVAEKVMADAKQAAQNLNDEANATIESANEKAIRIVEDARSEASKIKRDSDELVKKANAKVSDANDAFVAKQTELMAAESKLAKAQEQINKLLGA